MLNLFDVMYLKHLESTWPDLDFAMGITNAKRNLVTLMINVRNLYGTSKPTRDLD